MRAGKAIALVAASLLAAPTGAPAQTAREDERVRQDAAALPDRLWEPGPAPVSPAGPGLPDEAGGATPLIALLLMLGALCAGYAIGRPRRSPAMAAAAPAAEPPPVVDTVDNLTETCVIALSQARGRGQFDVRIRDEGGYDRVVARSLSFAVPPGAAISEDGDAGRAHRRLLLHLVAVGWRLEPPGDGPWYERRLSRPLHGENEVDRALVTTRPEGGEAEFVALALDEYGNAHVMARSPRFVRRHGRPVEESEPAVAAHRTLLEDLAAHGWRVSGRLESWYGATLARRRR